MALSSYSTTITLSQTQLSIVKDKVKNMFLKHHKNQARLRHGGAGDTEANVLCFILGFIRQVNSMIEYTLSFGPSMFGLHYRLNNNYIQLCYM